MQVTLPAEFNAALYKLRNKDLESLNESQLRQHWETYGIAENRNAGEVENRSDLAFKCLASRKCILEIGPFDRPTLQKFEGGGKTIEYADFLGTEDLKKRASQIPGRNPDNIPHISHVLAEGFGSINKRYDAIVSHHCIEHQPDLVTHIRDIFSILDSGGIYMFTAPHKTFCFDHFIPESTIVDIIAAHLEGRSRPGLRSVIEHRCFTRHDYATQVDPYDQPTPELRNAIERAHAEFRSSEYVDVHCWQFTPVSFRKILSGLSTLGYLPTGTQARIFCLGEEFGCIMCKA